MQVITCEEVIPMAEEKKKLSVYEYIRTHLDGDGRLEKGCRIHVLFDRAHRELPEFNEPDGYLDAAVSGPYRDPDFPKLHEIIRLASEGHSEEALVQLDQYFDSEEHRALACREELQRWVPTQQKSLGPGHIVEFGRHIIEFACKAMVRSDHSESVKLGLALIGLFDLHYLKKLGDIIETLALSEEFTLFCAFAVNRWPDRNQRIFEMVKKVHGWGMLAAGTELEPETEEIREWLWDKEGIPTGERGISIIREDPRVNAWILRYVLSEDSERNRGILAIYEQKEILESLVESNCETGNEEKSENTEELLLVMLLDVLKEWAGEGEAILLQGLRSYDLYTENMALEVVNCWKEQGIELSDRILAGLELMKKRETDEKLKERINEILK